MTTKQRDEKKSFFKDIFRMLKWFRNKDNFHTAVLIFKDKRVQVMTMVQGIHPRQSFVLPEIKPGFFKADELPSRETRMLRFNLNAETLYGPENLFIYDEV